MKVVGNKECVVVIYFGFVKDLNVGNCILVDDGFIEMEVLVIIDIEVKCKVLNNGVLGENKGVNLLGVFVNLLVLFEKDKNDLKFGCE